MARSRIRLDAQNEPSSSYSSFADFFGVTLGVEAFYKAASAYCEWEEGADSSPEGDVLETLLKVTTIYHLALAIPDVYGEGDAPRASDDEYHRVLDRFSRLPFETYALCCNPLALEEDPVHASIAVDLADIWRDLREGIYLYRDGHIASATWHWRFGFLHHWGKHAVSAIAAMHAWLIENPDSDLPSRAC